MHLNRQGVSRREKPKKRNGKPLRLRPKRSPSGTIEPGERGFESGVTSVVPTRSPPEKQRTDWECRTSDRQLSVPRGFFSYLPHPSVWHKTEQPPDAPRHFDDGQNSFHSSNQTQQKQLRPPVSGTPQLPGHSPPLFILLQPDRHAYPHIPRVLPSQDSQEGPLHGRRVTQCRGDSQIAIQVDQIAPSDSLIPWLKKAVVATSAID